MSFKKAFIFTLLAEAAVIALGIINYEWGLEQLQAVVRFSGRLSLFIFSIIFILRLYKEDTLHQIISEKYYLIFAIAHGIHLVELVSFVIASGITLIPGRIAGGVLAYLFIFVMPWFYERNRTGHLSAVAFRRLEFSYLFYVWFIFLFTYVPRVLGKLPHAGGTYAEHVVLLGWTALIAILKLVQHTTSKRPAK
jgi:hypothetical protein